MDKSRESETTAYTGSMADIVKQFYSTLATLDVELVPHPAGSICGNKAYLTKPLKVNPAVSIKRQPRDKSEFDSYCQKVDAVLHRLPFMEDEEVKLYRKIALNLTVNTNDPRSPVSGYARGCAAHGSYEETRSYGGQVANKQVPSKSWFPHLKDLDPRLLLTLFPDAEYQLMLLLLGRTMCGVGGTKALEGQIDHRMRCAGMVVGFEAGLGKSTLLGYLLAALTELGYDSIPIGGGGRFGWGDVAESDLAYRDDLTDSTQASLLQNDIIKSIVTGGSFSAERKGTNAYQAKGNSTILCFTNVYNPYHFTAMDEGSISRWAFLYTYNRRELNERWGFDGRTDVVWSRLAAEYGSNPLELACYLFAHAAEVFLDTIGYTYENLSLQLTHDNTLEETVNELRDNLTLSPNLNHVPALVGCAARLIGYGLAVAALTEDDEAVALAWDNLKSQTFNYQLLYETVAAHIRNVPAAKIEGLDKSCNRAINGKLEEISNKDGRVSSMRAFEVLIGELLSDKGYRYPKSPAAYAQYWEEAKKDCADYAAEYALTLEAGTVKDKVAKLTAESVISLLTT